MASGDVALRQFLRTSMHLVRGNTDLAETERALDKWAIIVCQALHFARSDIAEYAITVLHDAYTMLPPAGASLNEKRLAVVLRLYAVGSLAVRLRDWQTVRSIVLRTAKSPLDDNYVYSSWIREGQVAASRAGLTQDNDDGGYLISATRRLLINEPAMRPDIPASAAPDGVRPAGDDALLDSLCQFDILYCLLVLTEGTTPIKSMYPWSAAFHEARADPALVRVAGDAEVRAALFPNTATEDLAAATARLLRSAMQESMSHGGRWGGPPPSVQEFLTSHGQDPA